MKTNIRNGRRITNQTKSASLNPHSEKSAVTVPETGQFVWGMVKSGEVTFMFQEVKSIKEEYPELDKFETLYESLKGKATISEEIHTTPYGANEFAIEDVMDTPYFFTGKLRFFLNENKNKEGCIFRDSLPCFFGPFTFLNRSFYLPECFAKKHSIAAENSILEMYRKPSSQ